MNTILGRLFTRSRSSVLHLNIVHTSSQTASSGSSVITMFRDATFKQDGGSSETASVLEKQSRSDVELHFTQDELAKRSDEFAEMANAQAKGELKYFQRLVDDLNFRLKEAIEASKKDRLRANRMEIASFTAAEDWKVELEAMQRQYEEENSRLQKENKVLKYEMFEANKAKEVALRMARDALLAGEDATKQMESLSVELEKAMEATAVSRQETMECRQVLDELAKQKSDLSEAYAACQKSAQAGVAILTEKEAELKKHMAALFQAKQQAELLRWELFESRKIETTLCEVSNELEVLKNQHLMAKQIEEQQAKVVVDADAKLQEAQLEVGKARAAKNDVATLLTSAQTELQENRQKWMMASTEVSALTANIESMKKEIEAQQMQIRTLQRRDAESEAKLLEVSEKLADSLAREQKKNEALNHLACSSTAAKLESQLLRQHIYEAVFEAQFSEVEIIKELMSLHTILQSSECIASKARVDLQDIFNELCSERELAVLGLSLKDSSTECASGSKIMMVITENGMAESHESIEVEALPASLEVALAACKPAAFRIALNLKVIGAQLDRIREEAEVILAATSEPSYYHHEKEQARQEALAQPDHGRGENLTTAKTNQFQGNLNQEKAWDENGEVQGKFRELSEPWEIVDSGSEATVTIKKEEFDALKLRLHEFMELTSCNESHLLSLRTSNQRLSTQLDATNMEIKALRLSEQSTFQQYDKLQQRNMFLEAEMRSLKGKGEKRLKSWEVGHKAFGVDANTLHNPQLQRKQHTSSQLSQQASDSSTSIIDKPLSLISSSLSSLCIQEHNSWRLRHSRTACWK
ncbi:hypothetical protein GOP47_0013559 [Adiantum capillus-veneris]|uniref:Uncharacterized protein n=1 Tax=Adiantum capillus-veneris TaxID=13818 RepID=A0A9D4UNR4_ADICA|nr:hypothetical protein GOP47_0013559 [Adiantum capillus-veneris]